MWLGTVWRLNSQIRSTTLTTLVWNSMSVYISEENGGSPLLGSGTSAFSVPRRIFGIPGPRVPGRASHVCPGILAPPATLGPIPPLTPGKFKL